MNPLMQVLGMMSQSNPQQVLARANQLMQSVQNPQNLVRMFFPDVPQEMRSDPDKIIQYLIGQNRITEQQVNQIRQMFGK